MFLVLLDLAESGPSRSGEVAERLNSDLGLDISPGYASLVLARCYGRGFVSRDSYRVGRVRGFDYELADKGVEWMLYKACQWKNADRNDLKPTMEAGKEDIHPSSVDVLKQNQQIQARKDFLSMKTEFLLSVVYLLWRSNRLLKRKGRSLEQECETLRQELDSLEHKCESLEESDDLTFLALLKVVSDRNACFCAYWTEREARLERENLQRTRAGAPDVNSWWRLL